MVLRCLLCSRLGDFDRALFLRPRAEEMETRVGADRIVCSWICDDVLDGG